MAPSKLGSIAVLGCLGGLAAGCATEVPQMQKLGESRATEADALAQGCRPTGERKTFKRHRRRP
jgi:hypothetical protein